MAKQHKCELYLAGKIIEKDVCMPLCSASKNSLMCCLASCHPPWSLPCPICFDHFGEGILAIPGCSISKNNRCQDHQDNDVDKRRSIPGFAERHSLEPLPPEANDPDDNRFNCPGFGGLVDEATCQSNLATCQQLGCECERLPALQSAALPEEKFEAPALPMEIYGESKEIITARLGPGKESMVDFSEDELMELMERLTREGQSHPAHVKMTGVGWYETVDGESFKLWLAVRQLGWKEIKVVVAEEAPVAAPPGDESYIPRSEAGEMAAFIRDVTKNKPAEQSGTSLPESSSLSAQESPKSSEHDRAEMGAPTPPTPPLPDRTPEPDLMIRRRRKAQTHPCPHWAEVTEDFCRERNEWCNGRCGSPWKDVEGLVTKTETDVEVWDSFRYYPGFSLQREEDVDEPLAAEQPLAVEQLSTEARLARLVQLYPCSFLQESSQQSSNENVPAEADDHINLSLLFPSRYLPKIFYEHQELREMAEALKTGQSQPLRVVVVKDCYELLGDAKILEAAELAGISELRVEVLEFDPDATEFDWEYYVIVENRSILTDLELARFFLKLKKDGSLSNKEIAEVFELPTSKVSKLTALLEKLVPDALARMERSVPKDQRLTYNQAIRIMALPPGKQQVEVRRLFKKTQAQ